MLADSHSFADPNPRIIASLIDLGGTKPFANTDSRTAEFGAPSETEGMSTRYQEILAEQKKKYRDWVMCPSKYEPEQREPLCMGRRTKSFKAGSIDGTGRFGYSNHTPWEEFQNTIAAKKYQKVVAGTAFPRR